MNTWHELFPISPQPMKMRRRGSRLPCRDRSKEANN
jgi:hypothetical protein